ncbi:MAG: hormogonium polysaccharide biosynthesis glycosyltransferase HpsE [Cyanobacteria bacterium P01_D01_bin.156]
MTDFSVAIRLYNGASVLPEILNALQSQVFFTDVDWEVIIVDNNSVDNTAEIVRQYQQTWNECPLRYVLETEQGASFARRRAILEAQGTWIGFLDDDNIPDRYWVQSAYAFGCVHPYAAAFGSQIHPLYETPPPADFERIAPFIPIVQRDEAVCFTTGWRAASNLVPPGAGLIILRQAWLDHVPYPLKLQGPVGKSLAGKGEDVEALLYLKKAGWEIWFNPNQHIDHQIPSWRFERSYLLRFFHGIGLSKYTTRVVGLVIWKRPLVLLLFMINDGRKLLVHLFRHYHHLPQDVVAAAELQLLISSFLSPFYAIKQGLTTSRVTAQYPKKSLASESLDKGIDKTAALSSYSHAED